MNTPLAKLRIDLAPRAREKRAWRRALRALRALLQDAERTDLVMEITAALDRDLPERNLARFLSYPAGRRLYEERPDLGAALCDRAALERLPEGSLGRAYLEHLDRNGLEPTKLVRLSREYGLLQPGIDTPLRWYLERGQMSHDLWHVLTGYGADPVGETSLLPFSLAQTGGRANVLLTLGASARVARAVGWRWLPYAWKAWRRGRRAARLELLPWEQLLAAPLADVRAACGIEPPERAHPKGIWSGDAAIAA